MKARVKQLLEQSEYLRDGRDQILYIIARDLGLTQNQASFIVKHFKDFANADRYWRQVQQENPELRGKDWLKRQAKAIDKQKELGYNV
jgi:hypothetical protein